MIISFLLKKQSFAPHINSSSIWKTQNTPKDYISHKISFHNYSLTTSNKYVQSSFYWFCEEQHLLIIWELKNNVLTLILKVHLKHIWFVFKSWSCAFDRKPKQKENIHFSWFLLSALLPAVLCQWVRGEKWVLLSKWCTKTADCWVFVFCYFSTLEIGLSTKEENPTVAWKWEQDSVSWGKGKESCLLDSLNISCPK